MHTGFLLGGGDSVVYEQFLAQRAYTVWVIFFWAIVEGLATFSELFRANLSAFIQGCPESDVAVIINQSASQVLVVGNKLG